MNRRSQLEHSKSKINSSLLCSSAFTFTTTEMPTEIHFSRSARPLRKLALSEKCHRKVCDIWIISSYINVIVRVSLCVCVCSEKLSSNVDCLSKRQQSHPNDSKVHANTGTLILFFCSDFDGNIKRHHHWYNVVLPTNERTNARGKSFRVCVCVCAFYFHHHSRD